MKRWTNEEIKILRDNYQIKSREDLCCIFSNRTWRAVQAKACELQLPYYKYLDCIQRFWKYANKKSNNDCWDWTGACNSGRYGMIRINRKNIGAHRFSWELHFDKIPNGLLVCHHCDNPTCVNPFHLFLGTTIDNTKDMFDKGRANKSKGEDNGMAKLTSDNIKEIRYLKGKFTQKALGEMFDVRRGTIGKIHRNERWKHIK